MSRITAAVVGALMFLVSVPAAWAQQAATITILHLNDSHGQTLGTTVNGKQWGGYARLSTKLAELRQELGKDHTLLLHAGDEFSRGDAMTSSSVGEANIRILNALDIDAMTPGNGEFYVGLGTLQQRIREASFPMLTANVRSRLGGQIVGRESTFFTVQGVKIGIVGLCFVRREHPSAYLLRVEDPTATARRVVPALREKCDYVIALDHLGFDVDQKLAADVPGIDLIVGGHTHTTLPKGSWVDGPGGKPVLIVQAGDFIRFLGRVDLQFTRDNDQPWKLKDAHAALIPLDATVPEDPAIKAMIARMWPATRPATNIAPQPAGVD
jgi:5'-nucleotidase